MEGKCTTEDIFSYQQNVDGMKFSIDQLNEQIGEIDKRMESAWMDLKNICESFCGDKFDGTLEAVDKFLSQNILENSVCSTTAADSMKTVCIELINFLKKNPGSESQVFDTLLRVQFKEGLNFPICFRNAEGCEASKKSLFDGDQCFNELFTIFQKNFLDHLLLDETNEVDFKRFSTRTTSSGENQNFLPGNYQHFVCFAKEKFIEDKRLYFQRLCLLSSPDHSLILYANSKSLLIKNKIAELQSTVAEFTRNGTSILSMIEEDAHFLRFCIGEDDVLNFVSTVYLDPMLAALGSLVETATKTESPKRNNKLESSKKSSSQSNIKQEPKSDDPQLLKGDQISKLLKLLDWLLMEADARVTRMYQSSARCMVGQERLRSANEKTTKLKSALKNSSAGKGKKQSNQSDHDQPATSVFGWKSVMDKFTSPLLLSLGNELKECLKDQNNFVLTSVPASLQPHLLVFSVASKNSVELVGVLRKFWCFMKFVASSDKNSTEKLMNLLFETCSENVEMISKKINKEVSIESLVVILSGISFLETHFKQLVADIQVSDQSTIDLLLTAKNDLVQLVRVKFMNVITISVWHNKDEPGCDDRADSGSEDEENEPEYWVQNWWLQMEWLWYQLASRCSFDVTSQVFSGCLGECLQTFAWHFASKRLQREHVRKFTSNIQSLLSGALDLLFRCSRRSEEVIDVCSNDGAIHEIHVSCVALTMTLLVTACPLDVLKEMYDQFSDKSKQGLHSNAISGSERQWLHITKPKWNLTGKTRLDQLDPRTSYEVMFGLLEHYHFEKESLLLQMMFLHGSSFTISLLRHLCLHEAVLIGNEDDDDDDGKKEDGSTKGKAVDGDHDDDDNKGVSLVIQSLLLITFNHRPIEEAMFENILLEALKGHPEAITLKKKSTIFKFLCSSLEPLTLRVVWKTLIEIDESSLVTLSLLASDVSYFSKDRLFCGCKPSESEVQVVKHEDVSNQVKIFVSELLKNLHHFPCSVLRFCFKFDESKSGVSDARQLPFVVELLLVALKKVIKKARNMKLFKNPQLETIKSVVDEMHRLTSSSSSSSANLSSDDKSSRDWFKENCLDKIYGLGKEILRNRKDENDPGFGMPKSHLSSLVFETLLQSVQSNESSRKSMDILTAFFRDNFCQLKTTFEAEAAKHPPEVGGTKEEAKDEFAEPRFDFSSLRSVDDDTFKGKVVDFNPLTSLEVFKVGKIGGSQIDWGLCKRLDLGLTEVNLPNLLVNRPEFRSEELPTDVGETLKEFLNLVKQKHLRNPI